MHQGRSKEERSHLDKHLKPHFVVRHIFNKAHLEVAQSLTNLPSLKGRQTLQVPFRCRTMPPASSILRLSDSTSGVWSLVRRTAIPALPKTARLSPDGDVDRCDGM